MAVPKEVHADEVGWVETEGVKLLGLMVSPIGKCFLKGFPQTKGLKPLYVIRRMDPRPSPHWRGHENGHASQRQE
jgi:hypothetical protein